MSIPFKPLPASQQIVEDTAKVMDRTWEVIQQKTFTKWFNSKLAIKDIPPIEDLYRDVSDGVRLIELLEIIGDLSFGRYNKKPKLRIQKVENVNKALEFIKHRGVPLTNIGAEDIVDTNIKLILGMIWTIILRFTIADISEEGLTAKEGLLLWCQRKTAPYAEVDTDRHSNTSLAFEVAAKYLDIPKLLDVEDVCDIQKPDERSIMTYVALYFHAFSHLDKIETAGRRVAKFAEVMQSVWDMEHDYERRVKNLMKSVKDKINTWANPHFDGSYSDAKSQSTAFNQYKYTEKRSWVAEKSELDTLLGNIQTKLNTYQLQPYKAPDGLTLSDLDKVWQSLLLAETKRYKSIHNKLKDIKENLRKSFAQSANDFQKNLESISYSLVELDGELEIQLSTVKAISAKLGPLEKSLGQIQEIDARCQEANIEENDYTVFSVDDLKFELGLVQQAVTKKISFIENQIVSRNMTNLTPAQLEEFESTFRHFDKDSSNTLNLYEFKAALASLGIFYNEEELFSAFNQMCEGEPEATFEQFILYMVSFTEDKTTPDQLRSSFKAVASDKPFVTELDLKRSLLSTNVVSYLKETMPQRDDVADGYDYEKYLDKVFGY
nr:2247_t:CDS:10 [Entrophospora candida]